MIWPASKALGMARISRLRAGGVGCGEDVGLGGVSDDGLDPVGMKLGDRLVGVLDDQERQAVILERFADQAADPAVADQDRVAGEFRYRRRAVLVRLPVG